MNKVVNRRAIAAFPFLLALLFLCFTAAPASAQEGGAADSGEAEQRAGNQGGDLVRTLGLTPEQIARIRMIREQNREEQQLANERLRDAQRALDEAIYSDNSSESLIEDKARELAAAQTTAARLRALRELRIRRVLTPDQLATLRSLRQQQIRQRRLQRGLNLPRRLSEQGPVNNAGQPAPTGERLRQRRNNTAQQNDGNQPAAVPRARRGGIFRRGRP